MEDCTKLEVTCPNEGCQEKVVYLYLPKHREECPYESVSCRYETLGCKFAKPQMQKNEIIEHENNLPVHVGLMVTSFHRQQVQQAYFKIENFSYYQSLDKTFKYNADMWNWYMYIVIEANGRGEGKGTHISLSLHWKYALCKMPSWVNKCPNRTLKLS